MNNNYDLENHEFIQEVDEFEINSNLSYKNKSKKWIIILICLVILSFLTIFLGIYLYYKTYKPVVDDSGNKKNDIADLFVVHSKSEFGDTIKSFAASNVYNYSFYVENNTAYDIDYSISLDDVDFGTVSNLCNKENINFDLIANGKSLISGVMKNEKEYKFVDSEIGKNQKIDFILKLWSDNGCDGYLKYKIIISD